LGLFDCAGVHVEDQNVAAYPMGICPSGDRHSVQLGGVGMIQGPPVLWCTRLGIYVTCSDGLPLYVDHIIWDLDQPLHKILGWPPDRILRQGSSLPGMGLQIGVIILLTTDVCEAIQCWYNVLHKGGVG